MTVDKKLFKGNLYICETIPYVIEDDVTDVGYVFVPQDSYRGYKELNPTLNKLYPYNYRAINVGTTNKELYEALTVAISTETNAPVMQVMYSKGLCENPNYMTIAECRAVTNEQIDSLFEGNNDVVSFMEFQYFTSCTRTGKRMLMNAENIERIELPKTITYIDERFATFATALVKAGKKSKLKYIGGCENVEEISTANPLQFLDSLEYINFTSKLKRKFRISSAYYNYGEKWRSKLKSVGDFSGMEELETYAFQGMTELGDVNLTKLTTIPSYAFIDSNIKPILNWKNITQIGNFGFSFVSAEKGNGARIDYITDADNLVSIGTAAFQNLNLRGVGDLPSLTTLGEGAFNMAHNLEYVGNMPELTTMTKQKTFNSCIKLKRVGDMPKLTQIPMFAFEIDYELQTIGDVSSLTFIGDRAFGRCYSFSKYFPAVTEIGDYAFCMDSYNDPMEKPRRIEFATPYDQMTFQAEPFKACTMTTIIMGGVELTDEQYAALGATKPAFS